MQYIRCSRNVIAQHRQTGVWCPPNQRLLLALAASTHYAALDTERSGMDYLIGELTALRDEGYRDFHAKLMPTVPKERIIGVRVPDVRRAAKRFAADPRARGFMEELPHRYYEEDNVHALLIERLAADAREQIALLDAFLPFVDNWATCDMIRAPHLATGSTEALGAIRRWLDAPSTYEVRFGVDLLMNCYLDNLFKIDYLQEVADVRSGDYYIDMARAWYFSVALVKHYDEALPYFTEARMDAWTHNKALQKARESRRIGDDTKAYLQTLKVKGPVAAPR